jgi:CubicO group peptidase (beta-lactamase class C family)
MMKRRTVLTAALGAAITACTTASRRNARNEDASQPTAPNEDASQRTAPNEAASQRSAPVEDASPPTAPVEDASPPTAPVEDASQRSAPTEDASQRSAPNEGPGAAPWRHSTPEAHGLSLSALDVAANRLAAAGERQGLVVIRHGELVYERYWANEWARAVPEWQNVSFSSGKSGGSTMVGRAVTQGKLTVGDLVSKYHPPERSGFRPQTTIEHLLTMTSGGTMNMKPSSKPPNKLSDPTPPGPGVDYEWYDRAEAGTPPGYGSTIQPGERFFYDGAAADHLADVVAAAVGKSSHRYMLEDLVAPLGCEHFSYQPEGVDANDNVRIGGSILISCRDMARLGQLYLNLGRWGGEQLIDASYIEAAIKPAPLTPGYGYLWWLNASGTTAAAPRSMYYAAGARGQFCFALPEQDMVIATMGFGEAQLSALAAWDALRPILPS